MKAIVSLAFACAAAALPQLPVPQPTTGPVQGGPAKGIRPPPNIAQWLGKMGIDLAKATPVPGGGRCQQLENGRFCFAISTGVIPLNPGLLAPGGGGGPAPRPGLAPQPGGVPRPPQPPPPPPAGGNAEAAKKAAEKAAEVGPAKASVGPIGALVPTMVGPGGATVPPTAAKGAAGPARTGGQ